MSKLDPYQHLRISLNPDGSLTRHHKLPTSAATGESPQNPSAHAVLSKDVTLNADKKTWMRIYLPAKLPSNDNSVARLPIIFFFHGGGWISTSVADTAVHESSNCISAEVPAIVVSVEFRLAPESRLPAQYDDAADAVFWVRNQAADQVAGDQWITDYGDFSRCYLYGASCGANIAFNAALRMQQAELQPLKIAGTILNQPFFGANRRTGSELNRADDQYFPLPVQDLLWELALPVGTDRDHRYCNPFAAKEKVKNVGRCLVIGYGGDPLIDRQQDFVEMLTKQGVTVEARFDDVGFHGIDMIDSKRTIAILNFIKLFV
ncbi:hypothetical protein ACP275_02G168900 [Erythranthe tilingii]